MRYVAHIAYNGSNYNGWQIQPNADSVQSTIEQAISTILNTAIKITGCGRTDTGVHAKSYYFHFDFKGDLPQAFTNRINKFLPKDIVVYRLIPVSAKAHARFDAFSRSYEYHVVLDKNPFEIETAWAFYSARKLDLPKMQAAAQLLLNYKEFIPFCKTNSDAKTMKCDLTCAEWKLFDDRLVFYISANRFLRGMVRLIVGMCINVGLEKLTIESVQKALDSQSMLPKSYSVPSNGLFLTKILYPPALKINKLEDIKNV